MKYSAFKTSLSSVLLLISGCVTEPKLLDPSMETGLPDPSLHSVKFSIKNGLPCFAPKDDSTLPQSTARIHTAYVMRNLESNSDYSFMWIVRWQEPIRLAQGECIQYGTDAGRKLYVLPSENCTAPRSKHERGSYKLLASGECVGDSEAQKLEKGVTYFVAMDATKTDRLTEGEGHYIRDFFCLTDDKNGKATVHRLRYNPNNDSIETCPGAGR